MLFKVPDLFVRFLQHKAHRGWSSMEVLEIFKHRYGDSYDVALANMLMDSLNSNTKKTRKSKEDKEYEKMYNKELSRVSRR